DEVPRGALRERRADRPELLRLERAEPATLEEPEREDAVGVLDAVERLRPRPHPADPDRDLRRVAEEPVAPVRPDQGEVLLEPLRAHAPAAVLAEPLEVGRDTEAGAEDEPAAGDALQRRRGERDHLRPPARERDDQR